ncbi:hypothetical protein [Actinocatenispora rupis]|uniref:Uncharacterized protein n=1 Tax=Actinocatenispora rupis TaxID=519421 RepID=A0A8J3J2C7_9ACTN|nr:hypothetical protein [Actinocatenispora rupis]GID14486.1 hypothetical protein Aru02nite_53750 [Actinocatenispora rupis]
MEKLVVAAIVVAAVLVYLVPVVITGLKGKQGMVFAGLFLHPVWWVGAIRLAKPDSYWARRFYPPEKMDRARAREVDGPLFQPESDRLAALSHTKVDPH